MKKICAVLLSVVLMLSCLPLAFAGQGAAESNASPIPTSKWVLTGGDWWNAVGQPGRADYYGTVNITLSFDAAAGTLSYAETRMDHDIVMFNLEGTFTADETTCTVRGGGMELTAGYMIAGNSLVVTTPYGMGLFTRVEEPEVISSPIPTSSWVLTGGDWWNAVGQPGRADYYGTVNVTLSFDAAAGTLSYTETRVDNGRPMFTLEGTFTADETTCTVQGGGMELSAGYMIAGDSMVVTTPYGMGFFTRAEAAPAASPIPTSKWILFGGDWWNAIGQPGMADYYATVNVTLSFDAKAGTVVYSEDRADNGRNMFSLNGTYTADETSCTVKGGGTELTANYILAGDYLTVTTPYGIGLFNRAN